VKQTAIVFGLMIMGLWWYWTQDWPKTERVVFLVALGVILGVMVFGKG